MTTTLPAGPAFWRVRANGADGAVVSSATWVFRVAHRRAAVDTSWLQGWDSNGDGVDDIPLGWFGAFEYGSANLAHVAGPTAWPLRRGQTSALDGGSCTDDMRRPTCIALGDLQPAGDVDGDGFADALARVAINGEIQVPNGSAVTIQPHVLLFHGREAGGPDPADSVVCSDLSASVALGDIDGDGFADVAVRCAETWQLYRGSESGLVAMMGALTPPVISALDVNGDGLSDVLTGDGLRLGASGGPGAALDVTPMPVPEVVGAVARADGSVDFVARGKDQLTVWQAVPGEASRVVQRLSLRPSTSPVQEEVIPVGDVDGDGFDDIAVGQDSMGGWVQVLACGPRAPSEALLRWTKDSVVSFGRPVAIGDANGDGYDDLGVRATNDIDVNEHVYLGGPNGLASQPAASWGVSSHP